jgi:hypothetical protein
VLVFNYRGYGRSEGHPTPHDINNDGECIIDYLKNEKVFFCFTSLYMLLLVLHSMLRHHCG